MLPVTVRVSVPVKSCARFGARKPFVGSCGHEPAERLPVHAILGFGGVTGSPCSSHSGGGGEPGELHERDILLAVDERRDGLGVERGDVAVAMRVGVGREPEEIIRGQVKAGAGRVEAGDGGR